jgi:5-methyltetrahydrofolate--homocysteine methyltransferase
MACLEVIDFGPDVPADKFITEIRKGEPKLGCLLALLTTTMPMMRTIMDEIETSGVRDLVKIMVGGAGVSQEYVDQIGAQSPQSGRACFLAG